MEIVFSMTKQKHRESLTLRYRWERRKELLIGAVLRCINQLNFLECAGNQSFQRDLEVHNVFEVEWFDQTTSVVEH